MDWCHCATCKLSESGERQLAKLLYNGTGLLCHAAVQPISRKVRHQYLPWHSG